MNFVTAIFGGASVRFTAEEYAEKFLEAVVADPENWLYQEAHHFVGECFAALGLTFNVSLEAFSQSQDQPYHIDNVNYIFDADPFVLEGVEAFLRELPAVLAEYGRTLAANEPSSDSLKELYDKTQPLPCYFRVVSIWIEVVHAITSKLPDAVVKYICEPVARLSFSILRGLVQLLPDYVEQFPQLKGICLSLTVAARYGIFYEATCKFMLPCILEIFKEHNKLFCGVDCALSFIYHVCNVEMPHKMWYIEVYKFLETMMEKFAREQQRDSNGHLYLRLFTNDLITTKYLAIPFDALKIRNHNALLLATLHYLHTLQRHIVSAEVFPGRFLMQILQVLIFSPRASDPVCKLAAKLYITLAQRQYQETEIFVHILETFYKSVHGTNKCSTYELLMSNLSRYLTKLLPQFGPLGKFKFYTQVLQSQNIRDEMGIVIIQAICALFQHYTMEYASSEAAKREIRQLLRDWPKLVDLTANQPRNRTVLLSLYSAVDFNAVSENDLQLLIDLENFCVHIFLDDKTLSGVEYLALFSNICRSVDVTGNEQILLDTAQSLQYEYIEISMEIINFEQPSPQHKLEAYAHFQYGYECLAFMLALLFRERQQLPNVNEHNAKLKDLSQELYPICVLKLSNTVDDMPQTSSLFCAITILLMGLPHCIELDEPTYDALQNQLIIMSVGTHIGNLQRNCMLEMFVHFSQLHASLIPLPHKRLWRMLLLFKMPPMQRELSRFIGVLIEHRVELYVHCLAVIHLKVFNDSTPTNRVAVVLRGYLQPIDQHASLKDAWLLRVLIFKKSLSVMVRNLKARRMDSAAQRQRNLRPLVHFMPLVERLCLEECHFKNIADLLRKLKSDCFAAVDAKELDKFITHISRHKYRCEDEQAETATDKTVLQPQPAGPLNLWQTLAFTDNNENAQV
ncbi:uncharacterized protein LOC108601612 [Drosophila busckii]|uniref:uncharacterized protein LOC108601612 n=1 Tax=Drosophila busckii TaxID=30019 RepID=UPI00083F033E|nr:uncharacterized protein LOC108601612 [Drosophila busckii]